MAKNKKKNTVKDRDEWLELSKPMLNMISSNFFAKPDFVQIDWGSQPFKSLKSQMPKEDTEEYVKCKQEVINNYVKNDLDKRGRFDINLLVSRLLGIVQFREVVETILVKKGIISKDQFGIVNINYVDKSNAGKKPRCYTNVLELFKHYCLSDVGEIRERLEKDLTTYINIVSAPTAKEKGKKIWFRSLRKNTEGIFCCRHSSNTKLFREELNTCYCICGVILSGLATKYYSMINSKMYKRYEANLNLHRAEVIKRKEIFTATTGFGEF